ncbi:S24 family peptidase [Stutzerimonas stutzeri]|uniref:S24 family peptidase n=1 Tax=Stutzerimonas stutzeri TaxID=316 RepID=UPI001A9C93B6|nr:helix-turn-helix transcriptional regulator [Stutzerimonas stutzeri]
MEHISNLAASCQFMRMDINDIRRINLKSLMEGRTQRACAELWGTSPSYISQILSKKTQANLGEDVARRIEAQELLPHGWLDQLHNEGETPTVNNVITLPIQRTSELQLSGGISPWGSETPVEDEEVEVPLFKEVELAAGAGANAPLEIPGRVVRLSRATLRAAGVDPANAIAAQVTGYSMARLILDGATVGIDIGTTEIYDGEIYALSHDGMLRIKYVYRQPGGGLRLRSENAEEHPDEFYSAEQVAESIRVIGFVFWWSTIRPVRRRNPPL